MTVRVEERGAVLWVTLDRPPANAVDTQTSAALYAAFARLEERADLRVGVITGAGERFFCAGWDLHAAAGGEALDSDHGPGGFAGLTEMHARRKPVIAAVNGLALGGGFELALAADLIVASDTAEFGLPEVRLGLVADSGGVLRLPTRVPRALAVEMLLTGRRLDAAQARDAGLVSAVVAPSQLEAAAAALAGQLLRAAPLAVAAVLEILAATEATSIADGFRLLRSGTLTSYRAVLTSADAQEGPAAFAAHREPRWQGR